MVAKTLTKAAQVAEESHIKQNHLHSHKQSFQPGDVMSSATIKEILDKSERTDGHHRYFDDDSLPYYYYDDYFPTPAPQSDDYYDDYFPTPAPQSDDYYDDYFPTPAPQSDDYHDDYFPTPAPQSYNPSPSLNPTSTSPKDFSLVGQGFCYDQSYQYYSFVQSDYLHAHTRDTHCLDWCSQNPHPDLVGVEIYRSTNAVYCRCSFSKGVSEINPESDYSPTAWGVYDGYSGVGAIEIADGDSNVVCYRYEVSFCVALLVVKCLKFIPSNLTLQPILSYLN